MREEGNFPKTHILILIFLSLYCEYMNGYHYA